MSPATKVLGPILLGIFISAILFVLFGQITVRKLRKNPATKNALGLEFISGWDILNAAQALAWPECLLKKLEKGSLYAMHAKADILKAHTNKFDRALAKLFYYSLMLSGSSIIVVVILDKFGFFAWK